MTRQAINLRRLSLTKLKVVIPPSARSGTLTKAYAKAEIDKKWAETSYAKKLAMRTKRANLSDFDRFKVMVLRKQVRRLFATAFPKRVAHAARALYSAGSPSARPTLRRRRPL